MNEHVYRLHFPCMNGANVFICTSKRCAPKFNALIKKLDKNMLDLTDDASIGWTFNLEKGDFFVWVNNELEDDPDHGLYSYEDVVAHECFHVALRVSEFLCAHRAQDAEEPLAYMISTLSMAFRVLRKYKSTSARFRNFSRVKGMSQFL